MKLDDAHEINTWMEERIEPYLDGELPESERVRFETLLQEDEVWANELAWAVNIRDTLHAIPDPVCPPHVVQTVIRKTRWSIWMDRLDRLKQLFLGQGLYSWKPALATAVLLVVASAIVITNRPATPTVDAVSEAEVEQALEEVKWALGYVSKTGRLTGSSVHDALAPLRSSPADE